MRNLAVLILASMMSVSLADIFNQSSILWGFISKLPGSMCTSTNDVITLNKIQSTQDCQNWCYRYCTCFGGHYDKVNQRCYLKKDCYPRAYKKDYDAFVRVPEGANFGRDFTCGSSIIGTVEIGRLPTQGIQRFDCFVRCKNTCGCKAATMEYSTNRCTLYRSCVPSFKQGSAAVFQLPTCTRLKCNNMNSGVNTLGDVRVEICKKGKVTGKCLEKCPKGATECPHIKCETPKKICCLNKPPKKKKDKKTCGV